MKFKNITYSNIGSNTYCKATVFYRGREFYVTGKSRCNKDDEFCSELGESIALSRAIIKAKRIALEMEMEAIIESNKAYLDANNRRIGMIISLHKSKSFLRETIDYICD